MADALWSGRHFSTFNVNDDFNRESLRIEVDTSLPSARVIRAMNELIEVRGTPSRLRLDNGLEFISNALGLWAAQLRHGIITHNLYFQMTRKFEDTTTPPARLSTERMAITDVTARATRMDSAEPARRCIRGNCVAMCLYLGMPTHILLGAAVPPQ